MSQELRKEIEKHLAVSLGIFVFCEILWLARGSFSWLSALGFFAGLLLGTFFLDVDHLLYWFVLYPQKEESRKARQLWQEGGWRELLALLAENHKSHTSLIFHHFIFQAALLVLTIFILTSTAGLFGKGLILAIDAHLLADEWLDWQENPSHLQKWLFARTDLADAPLPSSWLKKYLLFYSILLGGLILVSFR